MKRVGFGLLLVGLALAGVVAATVLAGTLAGRSDTKTTVPTTGPPPTTQPAPTTTAPTTTAPAPKPKPKPKPARKPAPKPKPIRLPSGVRIGGVHVGGLTPSAAYTVVRLAYRAPLVLTVGDRGISMSPKQLGVTTYFWPAVRRAQHARTGSSIPLGVAVRGAAVRSFVAGIARHYDREVVDAKTVLRDLKPHVVPDVVGRMGPP